MKHTKRMLTMVLTFALAFSLAAPAFAAVNWDEFQITERPKNIAIPYGDSFTLGVEVKVPDGVSVEYQWRTYSAGAGHTPIENATSYELRLGPSDPYYLPNTIPRLEALQKGGLEGAALRKS
jgi:hypothetical protein